MRSSPQKLTSIFSIDIVVWLSAIERKADLTRRSGETKANEHYRAGGGVDGPPSAAAMAMPRPNRFIRTEAVSRSRFNGPDDAA
jgi:hypothetical protein